MTAVPTVAGPVTAAPMPSFLRLGIARATIELKQFFRERDAVVFIFLFPVILLFIFGSVFGDDIAPGVTFSQYFVAGMLASGLMVTGFQNLAIQIPVERDDGTLKRLDGSPLPKPAYFVGKVALVVVTMVCQAAILLAVGTLLFGLELPRDPTRWLTFAWLTVLGAAAFTLLGIAFSSVPRSGRSASAVVSPIVIILQFVSGVFFVYSELPAWMQQLASLLPLKWLTQGMRSVFLPDSFAASEPAGTWEHGRIALVLAAWVVVGAVVAVRTFRWRRRDDG
jgi:ABC-2 type transport system permease protein